MNFDGKLYLPKKKEPLSKVLMANEIRWNELGLKTQYRKDIVMVTFHGPYQEDYDYDKYKGYMERVDEILKPIVRGSLCEPYPDQEKKKRKSRYHMHWTGQFDGKKQITVGMQKNLAKIFNINPHSIQYTKSGHSTEAVDHAFHNLEYAIGKSKKNKLKHEGSIIKSAGYDELVVEYKERSEKLKTEKIRLNGFDPAVPREYIFGLLMAGMTVNELWIMFKKDMKTHLKNILYLTENLTRVKTLFCNIIEQNAMQVLMEKPIPEENWAQKLMHDILKKTAGTRHDGQLTCFVDPDGNAGKSWFQDMLWRKYGAVEFPSAKAADIASAYNYETMCNFNFPYSTNMHKDVDYKAMENLMDGKVFDGKYHSMTKRTGTLPRVNLFCNSMPDWLSMSPDRWNIYMLDHKLRTIICIMKQGKNMTQEDDFEWPEERPAKRQKTSESRREMGCPCMACRMFVTNPECFAYTKPRCSLDEHGCLRRRM